MLGSGHILCRTRLAACSLLTLLICMLVAAGTIPDVETTEPIEATIDVKTFIQDKCSFCHSEVLTAVLLDRKMQESRSGVDAFLANHHCPDAAMRASIIDYLETKED